MDCGAYVTFIIIGSSLTFMKTERTPGSCPCPQPGPTANFDEVDMIL